MNCHAVCRKDHRRCSAKRVHTLTSANLAYEQFLRAQTQALLQQADNPVFQIIDCTHLRRELEQPVSNFNSQLKRNNLETALSLAAWLKDYQLPL